MIKRIIISILLLFLINKGTFAQDNYFIPDGKIQKRVIHLVDDNSKTNLPIFAPKLPLGLIIYEAVTIGRKGIIIKAYTDTGFTNVIKPSEILKLGTYEEVLTYAPDPDYPDYLLDTVVLNVFESRNISKFLFVEDSLTDLNLQPAFIITAIAPVYKPAIKGTIVQEEPMFWVKMSDLIPVLSKEIYVSSSNVNGQRPFTYLLSNHLFDYSFPPDWLIKTK